MVRNLFDQEQWARRGENDARIAALETRIAAPATTAPAAPIEGQVWYETDTDIMWVWIGTEWRRIAPPAMAHFRWVAAAGNTNSATYVDFPGPISVAFTKRSASTTLVVHISGSSYSTVATGMTTQVGVQINGTDLDVCYFFHNAIGRHDGFAATATGFTSLAAGSYTARMRWKMGGAGGIVHVDGNDLYSLTVQEAVAT